MAHYVGLQVGEGGGGLSGIRRVIFSCTEGRVISNGGIALGFFSFICVRI